MNETEREYGQIARLQARQHNTEDISFAHIGVCRFVCHRLIKAAVRLYRMGAGQIGFYSENRADSAALLCCVLDRNNNRLYNERAAAAEKARARHNLRYGAYRKSCYAYRHYRHC